MGSMAQGLHLRATSMHKDALCASCGKPLALDEPITLCRDCRTPYHRDCWDSMNGQCEHPRRVSPAETQSTSSPGSKPSGKIPLPSTFDEFMAMARAEHVILWGGVVCGVLGFYFLSLGLKWSFVLAMGAALAGMLCSVVAWLELRMNPKEVPTTPIGHKLLMAALIGNGSVLLSTVFMTMCMVFQALV
jgi:hypothetical protein